MASAVVSGRRRCRRQLLLLLLALCCGSCGAVGGPLPGRLQLRHTRHICGKQFHDMYHSGACNLMGKRSQRPPPPPPDPAADEVDRLTNTILARLAPSALSENRPDFASYDSADGPDPARWNLDSNLLPTLEYRTDNQLPGSDAGAADDRRRAAVHLAPYSRRRVGPDGPEYERSFGYDGDSLLWRRPWRPEKMTRSTRWAGPSQTGRAQARWHMRRRFALPTKRSPEHYAWLHEHCCTIGCSDRDFIGVC